MNKNYLKFLNDLKDKIKNARIKAAVSVNNQLICLYWEIGKDILDRQSKEKWGSKVIERLSKDLSKTFQEMKGFSTRNLKYMRSFAEAYGDFEFVQQAAAQIPWFHNCSLLDKVKNENERKWYILKTIENSW